MAASGCGRAGVGRVCGFREMVMVVEWLPVCGITFLTAQRANGTDRFNGWGAHGRWRRLVVHFGRLAAAGRDPSRAVIDVRRGAPEPVEGEPWTWPWVCRRSRVCSCGDRQAYMGGGGGDAVASDARAPSGAAATPAAAASALSGHAASGAPAGGASAAVGPAAWARVYTLRVHRCASRLCNCICEWGMCVCEAARSSSAARAAGRARTRSAWC